MRNASRLTLKLTLGRVDANERVEEPLDGAMSAAPIKGQLPRRQRRHHRQHRHRQHRRHRSQQNLRNNNNNHHNHPHPHNGQYTCHGQCQYSSQKCDQEIINDSVENQSNHNNTDVIDNPNKESTEKRPKVNPIFLWASQREQKIIEVRCEDYDKRNRIKLTKTPQGWKSIPITSSNVYSSCSCVGPNNYHLPASKDNKPASSSPSVTSSCVPCVMSSKSSSSPRSSCSESTSFSSRSSRSILKLQTESGGRVKKTRVNEKKSRKTRTRGRRARYQVSDDESDATRSSCRNSGISYDLSCTDDQHDDPDDVDYNGGEDKCNKYEFKDNEESLNSSFLTYRTKTFGLIDLEKLQKNQLLQPRVVLEPLNTSELRLANLRASSKALDNEIEMVVEEKAEEENMENNTKDSEINLEEREELLSDHEKRNDDTEDEVEEIDDKEDMIELDEESATVFEYDDRESVDMMDDEDEELLQEREDNVLNPMEKLPTVPEHTFFEILHPVCRPKSGENDEDYLEDAMIDEHEDEEKVIENVTIRNQKKRVSGSIPQVPDLKPINETIDKISHRQKLPIPQISQTFLRILPSPPCSVTCSEDANHPEVLKNPVTQSITIEKKQRREAPDLIEVKPTEWRRRESLRPANQLRELIKRSGRTIPDPLLVPRDRLPVLAASPGIEIPRLLITRPELRLPEALSHPEFLTDPDLLVISLAHLQQVLDSVPDSKIPYSEEKSKFNNHHGNTSSLSCTNGTEKNRLSCKPIGSLMPAPMDLSRHSSIPSGQNSILRVRSGLLPRESEVTSTARLSDDDARLWHPLFGCRQKDVKKSNTKLLIPAHEPGNYQQQQQQQESNHHHQHRVSWHRTTLAS